jgi:hypothetical protein
MSMSDKALIPSEQKTVFFYEDEITAVVVDEGAERVVYVPLRPICDYLGLDWSAQYRRINRDEVLADAAISVAITATDIRARGTKTSAMLCLPLKFLNGWLFGVSAGRVKDELRERVIRYQRECYDVLAQAFQSPAARPDASSTLMQVREMGLAIVRMAEEQMEFDRRLAVQEGRMEQAAVVVADLRKRVTAVKQKLSPGKAVTDDQASQISQAVKVVALALGKKSGRNEFGAVYGELYRKFGITSYKMLPSKQFESAMKFLTGWYEDITGSESPF